MTTDTEPRAAAPLSEDELREIEARLSRIDPNWHLRTRHMSSSKELCVGEGDNWTDAVSFRYDEDGPYVDWDNYLNLAFAVHAPDDVRRLVAEVRRLQARVAELEPHPIIQVGLAGAWITDVTPTFRVGQRVRIKHEHGYSDVATVTRIYDKDGVTYLDARFPEPEFADRSAQLSGPASMFVRADERSNESGAGG